MEENVSSSSETSSDDCSSCNISFEDFAERQTTFVAINQLYESPPTKNLVVPLHGNIMHKK